MNRTQSRHLHQSKETGAQSGRPSLRSPRSGSAPRRRVWHISPEGFRELRHSCLLSVKACAELLGCSVSLVKAWDRGISRVPWSAVKLLRLLRSGDLGALAFRRDRSLRQRGGGAAVSASAPRRGQTRRTAGEEDRHHQTRTRGHGRDLQ